MQPIVVCYIELDIASEFALNLKQYQSNMVDSIVDQGKDMMQDMCEGGRKTNQTNYLLIILQQMYLQKMYTKGRVFEWFGI